MAVVISLGIAVVVVAFVAAPFFLLPGPSQKEAPEDLDTSEDLADLLAEKETIYAAIQELDFDLKSGKLSPEDHEALSRRHEAQAVAVLKRIDELHEAARQAEKSRNARREKRKA